MSIASFAAGFVAGWMVRSTVESSRALAVDLLVEGQELALRARRALIAERELLEDLWAEAKARVGIEREEDSERALRREPSVREVVHTDGGAPS